MLTTPLRSRVVSPPLSRPIGFAIVGANFGAGIARNLARGNAYVRPVAICDRDRGKAEALAEELEILPFDRIDDLLGHPEVEAVGLFTPPTGRAPLIHAVLEGRRHVMTTKPFELDPAAARGAIARAQELGLAIHLNSPAPTIPEDIAQIFAWIQSHELGRPIAMHAATWASYRETFTGTWYDDPELCPAAPICRLGVYFLNDFAMFFGEPERVHVMHSRVFTGRPTADNAQIAIQFAGGGIASVFASFCVADGEPWRDEVRLNFERGTIRRWVERTGDLDMAGDHAVVELRVPGRAPVRSTTRAGAFAGWYDWKAFHHAIRGVGDIPLTNPERVVYGVRLLDAMRRSAQSGEAELVHR